MAEGMTAPTIGDLAAALLEDRPGETLEEEVARKLAHLEAVERELRESHEGAPIRFLSPGDQTPCSSGRHDPDLWGSTLPTQKMEAAVICRTMCPFAKACAKHGVAHEKRGIWGGVDVSTGQVARDACSRGHVGQWVIRKSGRRYCRTCRQDREG